MPEPETHPTAPPLPIEALKRVLEDAGPEVQKLFVTALNTFVYPYANSVLLLFLNTGVPLFKHPFRLVREVSAGAPHGSGFCPTIMQLVLT